MKRLSKLMGTALLITGSLAAAQESFEVASIKPGDPADHRVMMGIQPGGRFNTANVPALMLITQAYEVQPFQITGAPEWVKTARWNIEAKLGGDEGGNGTSDPRKMTFDQMQAFQKRMQECMRSLLEERFGLKLHRETKEMPIYALVVGKGGSKLTEVPDPGPGKPRGLQGRRGELTGMAFTVEGLAKALSDRVGRPVHDETGLKAFYDFKLTWTPDQGDMMGMNGDPARDAPPAADQTGPSLFTAIQEQLGLKLESTKGPVEILAIDHVEKPSAN